MTKMAFVARGLALLVLAFLGCNGTGDEALPQTISTQRQAIKEKPLAALGSECVSAQQPRLIVTPSEEAPESAVQFEGKELNCGETYELRVTGPDGAEATESLVADAQGSVQSSYVLEDPQAERDARLYDSTGKQVAQLLNQAWSFRYGHLTWRTVGPRTAEFSLVNVFRRVYAGSGPDGLAVTGDTFQETYGYGSLCFGDGSCTGALTYRVTDYNAAEGWLKAQAVTSPQPQPLPGTGVTVAETEPNGTLATANSMEVGDDFTSTVSTSSDLDYVRFTLSARTRMQIGTVLGTMGDSYLYLLSGTGGFVASDDDSGPGLASLIEMPLDAGTYYIRAAGFGSSTGSQRVQLRQMGVPPTGPITHLYPSDGPFIANVSSCCRIEELDASGGGSYRLQTRVGFSLANSSPVSSLPPVIEVPTRTPDFSFQIPATDAEGDALTFRLAEYYESYLYNWPLGLTVSSTGLVSWDTTRTISGQLWPVQIIIEERRNGVLIGSSPVDFLLRITGDSGAPPSCVMPPQSRYAIMAGHTVQFPIGAQDPDAWDQVTLTGWSLPWDVTMEPPLPLEGPSGISSTFSYTPSMWDVGYILTPTFVVTDTQGQTSECTVEIEVLNPDGWPPDASAGSDQWVAEGSEVMLDGSASSDRDGDTLTYEWSLVEQQGPEVTLSSTTSPTPTFIASNQGVYTFQLTVTDSTGASANARVTVFVYNVAPEVSATGAEADEGQEYVASGSFTDPGADTWTAQVDYGDGSGWQPLELDGHTFTLRHRYLDDNPYGGPYWVTIAVTDDNGDQGSISVPVQVNNVAPVITAPASLSADAGQPVTASVSFTDPGQEDYWYAWVDYGDGYGDYVDVTNHEFAFTHTYYEPGNHVLTITVYDDDYSQQTVTVPVEIRNVAPTVSFFGGAVDEGTWFESYGTIDDPGRWWKNYSGTVDYGDGTGPQPLYLDYYWSNNFWLWHEYADNGTYVVTVTITDNHGGVGTATATVVVNNVAPWAYLNDSWFYANEGTPVLIPGYAYDQNPQDTLTATADYGDGTGPQPVEFDYGNFTLSHVYADAGEYTVTLNVMDDDGGLGIVTAQVFVFNAPPEVSLEDGTSTEGSVFTWSGSFIDSEQDGGWTAQVDYGDGTGWQPLALNGKSFTLSHVYANSGSYEVQVSVMDSEGEEGSAYAVITVLNVAPTVAVTSGTVNEGLPSNLTVTITDPGDEGTWWASIDYGHGSYSDWFSVNSRTFTLSHVYPDNGTYPVTVHIWDDTGVGSTTAQVVVLNVAPVVTVTGGTGPEGSAISLIGSYSDPGAWDYAVQIQVDYGDGSPVETFTPWYWNQSFAVYHWYPDNGTYTVTVSVMDDDGAVGTGTSSVTVTNVAPSVYLDNSYYYYASEGSPFSMYGGFSDPGSRDTFTATVDYGDGTGVQPMTLNSSTIMLNHVFPKHGVYTVTLTVRDDDGGVGTATRQVYVYNITPTVSVTGGSSNEGSAFTSSGSFTDPGADTWTARVDYGDGTGWQPLALQGKSFTLSHVYASSGGYGVSIVVRDSGGAEGYTYAYVNVRNVAPTVTATGGTTNEGSSFTLSATITDPGTESYWRAIIDYGDGSYPESQYLASKAFTLSHVFPENGTYTVRINISDDGGTGSTTTQVVVLNVAPAVTATGGTGNEGSWLTLSGAHSDPGTRDTFVVRIDYGDGSPVQTLDPWHWGYWERSFLEYHRYADNGTYQVTVSVTDDDGGVGSTTVPMVVRNVAPQMTVLVSCSPDEGAVCNTRGAFSDPGADSWTVTVNFGDGSAPREISLAAGASRDFDASHVYDDNGVYTLSMTVRDDDGGSTTLTRQVQVQNVAPTVTASNDSPRYWGMPVNLVGTATDPSQADTQAGFTSLWTLGDGTTASGLATTHAYADPGTYAARLRVTDKDGGTPTERATTGVTIQKRPGAVTCLDATVMYGFPGALSASFGDGLPGGLLGGRSLSFRLDASTALGSATTNGAGLGSVQSPGELMPGSYPITVSFAEDSHYTAAEAHCTLTVTQSSQGLITGGGLRSSNGGRGGFNVHREAGGPLQGELQFQNGSVSFHASEMTALGLSADQRTGWFAGTGRDGRTFTAYVEDNGEPGTADVFKLWIDGVLQTGEGDGTIQGGNIQIHDSPNALY